jgi:hypothetical protein
MPDKFRMAMKLTAGATQGYFAAHDSARLEFDKQSFKRIYSSISKKRVGGDRPI